jgi:tripartite motif-containing protein 2/3/tripartite motif-containing protein 71
MKMKKTVVKQMKEMTGNFKPDKLAPCEAADLKFVPSPQLVQACQQFGTVYPQIVSPEKCYATGKGLVSAEVGERATAVVHIVNDNEKAYVAPVEITCELASVSADTKTKCLVKNLEANKYEVSYQATSRGRHQLHIKVEGEHIKGSPFNIIVKLPVQKLGAPVKVIGGLNNPWGVVLNQRGEIIVAESRGHCISIFSPTGEKLRSFGSQGSGKGQFSCPRGVAVDDDGNILVVDSGNNRIQKFTSDGNFVVAVGKGTVNLINSIGISIHPINKKVIVSDHNNSCIQILNPDLTFSQKFGDIGTSDGQIISPYDAAFDSDGNMYQIGNSSNGVQVFTAEGQFLRKFGHKDSGQRELNFPSGIAIDGNNVVYVVEHYNNCVSIFTIEGAYLKSFGTRGKGEGQFCRPFAIAVDKDGFIYVCDYDNGRIQVF